MYKPLKYGGGGEKTLFILDQDMAVVYLILVFVEKSAGLRVAGLNRSRFGKTGKAWRGLV